MQEVAREFIALLVSIGPIGAVIAAVLVALALIVIVYAQVSGIFDRRNDAKQNSEFQEKLLNHVKILTDSEARVRQENSRLIEDVSRLAAMVELLRQQQRRQIELLRRLMTGKMLPGEITEADLGDGS